MPTSAYEGRAFFTNHLMDRVDEIRKIVDFGPGEGTYFALGRHIIPEATWIAVEVFHPYLERYDLAQKYDQVIVADMRLDAFTLADGSEVQPMKYDLAIFGDVLEHVRKNEAVHVLGREAERAKHIYVSCPIIPAPQGESHGNTYESHLYDWTFEEMTDTLKGVGQVEAWRGNVVGRWWVETNINSA